EKTPDLPSEKTQEPAPETTTGQAPVVTTGPAPEKAQDLSPGQMLEGNPGTGQGSMLDETAKPDPGSVTGSGGGAFSAAGQVARALDAYRGSGSFPALEDVLRALVREHPGQLTLREIGRSAGGRPLHMVVLDETGGAEGVPGILVLPELGRGSGAGPEAALATLIELLTERPGVVAETAGPTRWFVLPAPWPDRLAGAGLALDEGERLRAPEADLERNFPGGWDPAYGSGGSAGPYPLSRPESAALARFLVETPELAAVLVHRGGTAPDPLDQRHGTLPALDLSLAPLGGRSMEVAGARPGSFTLFACDQRGLFGAASWPWSGLAQGGGADRAADWGELRWRLETAGQLARALAEQLPRLELGAAQLRPLGPELWQLDLVLANRGGLPTLSNAARGRKLSAGVSLELVGGTLVAAAGRGELASHYGVLAVRGGAVVLPEIGAGEALVLRLVLSGAPGSSLTLSARAPRAAGAELVLSLP
ncbi:MAG: M14 family zinc carboxypeptidase, partial [Planctomycetota bacterium]|nr:M14 family zinc carboxypeptidase [Planctomycetota bacterium]